MTSDAFPIVGVTANWRKPGSFMQALFNQGNPSGQQPGRDILIICPMVSGGTYTANTIVQAQNEVSVVAGLGVAGTQGHRIFRMVTRANQQTKVWILPYAETSGGSPVAASTTITVTGTANAQTMWTIQICGLPVNVLIQSGFTNIQTADAAIANINTATWLPVTATGTGTGTVVLTCKDKGIYGGTSGYKSIRLDNVSLPGANVSITLPGDLGASTPGAEGTSTSAANMATAMAANLGSSHYYAVFANGGDTAANAAVASWLASQDLPLSGHPMQGVTAYTGTLATGITLATARNYERLQIVWAVNSDHDPAEIAGNVVAIRQKQENTDPAYIWKDYRDADWFILPAWDTTTWPSQSDLNDAINGGMTPIEYFVGFTTLVMSVDTRTKDSTGTYIDFRSSETHRVSAIDACVLDMQSELSVAMKNKKLVADPVLPNGKVDWNAIAQFGGKKTCPALIKPLYVKKIGEWETNDWTQRSAESIASLSITKSTQNNSRVVAGGTLYSVDGWLQTTTAWAEGTPG